MKSLWGEKEKPAPVAVVAEVEDLGPKYSESPQMPAPVDREYRRVTRAKLEEESNLQSGAGSLWVMDGQQSYLFAQNKIRREGDILSIKLEGQAQKQVETKVAVIKKLLKQLEEEERKLELLNQAQPLLAGPDGAAMRGPDGVPMKGPDGSVVSAARAPAGVVSGAPTAGAGSVDPAQKAKPVELPTPEKREEKKDEKVDLADIQTIPSRIAERMADGNYRVKGAQPFMIGAREYKVIVTGIIRPEDTNDEGVSTNKILDPQYDVVSVRRKSKDDKTALF